MEISYDEDDEIELLCQSCGREWGAANDDGDLDSDVEDGETDDGGEYCRYVCDVCGFIYDPEKGDPDSGISPGTLFGAIPDRWSCPLCGIDKDCFSAMEKSSRTWKEEEDDGSECPTGNYRITNRCVACGVCLDVCPVGAISEGRIYAIDKKSCVGCGLCASVCSYHAIQY